VERSSRSPTTWCLLVLLALATALPALSAGRSVLTAVGARQVSDAELRDAGRVGVFGEDAFRNAEGFAALVSAPAAVLALLLLVGLATWRTWAREAVLAVFGLVGALLAVFSLAGVAGGARNGLEWLAVAVALLAGAGLAASPAVSADFDRRRIAGEVRLRHQREQERRRQEQERRDHELRNRDLRDQALRDRIARDRALREAVPDQAGPDQAREDRTPDRRSGA
jgi:hypothetical protein